MKKQNKEQIESSVVIDINGKSFGANRCQITPNVIKFALIQGTIQLQTICKKSNKIKMIVWKNREKIFDETVDIIGQNIKSNFEGIVNYEFQKGNEFTFRIINKF